MYRVPPARAWWPAVAAPVDRGVRQRCDCVPSAMHIAAQLGVADGPASLTASRLPPPVSRRLTWRASCLQPPPQELCERHVPWPRRPAELTFDRRNQSAEIFRVPRRSKVILLVVITRANWEHGAWWINHVNCFTSGGSIAARMRVRRSPFMAVQFTPQGADSAGAPQGLSSDA